MERISAADPDAIDKAVLALRRGGIIAYPTDTIYGLGVDADNPSAVTKLYELKGRNAEKDVLIAVADLHMAKRYATITDKAMDLFHSGLLPGPISMVLPPAPNSPTSIGAQSRSIGLRLPNQPFVQTLLSKFGHAITSTSVNKSGDPPLSSPDLIAREFDGKVDVLIDAGLLSNPPSTLISFMNPDPRILREGMVPALTIFSVWEKERLKDIRH